MLCISVCQAFDQVGQLADVLAVDLVDDRQLRRFFSWWPNQWYEVTRLSSVNGEGAIAHLQ